MNAVCSKEGCTFADTGICVQNIVPIETCPEIKRIEVDVESNNKTNVEPVLIENEIDSYLPTGQVMHPSEISTLMSKEYTRVIGILGSPKAGKTAAIVSLYLLLSQGQLDGFSYRDSKTLLALEEITRGARTWGEGRQPEELTAHTRLTDDRQPGFVHLRISHTKNENTIGLLLSDLPGEWTTSFVERNSFERLSFLNSCKTIWIVIDGLALRDRKGRRAELHRNELLVQRLKENLNHPTRHNIVFIVTHMDQGLLAEQEIESIVDVANNADIPSSVHQIASFSTDNSVPPGKGIAELLNTTVTKASYALPIIWPTESSVHERNMMKLKSLG